VIVSGKLTNRTKSWIIYWDNFVIRSNLNMWWSSFYKKSFSSHSLQYHQKKINSLRDSYLQWIKWIIH